MVSVTLGMAIVFALIFLALVLFVTEWLPPDVTAILVLVSLAVFQPWTGVDTNDAIAGFASPATVTIIAMYILSEGIQETGLVERLGVYIGRFTGGDERRLLGTTVGVTGFSAGFVNNTPVVAVFIPMINGLAERSGISPSKLLIPLSFAAMLGGTLTLLGTATNLLASSIAEDLGVAGAPFGMFQFTPVGLIVLAVGAGYLFTVGRTLLPERIPAKDLTDEFELEQHLWRVGVRRRSPLVGETIPEALADHPGDVDVLQLVRGAEILQAAATDRTVEVDDVLTIRATPAALREFMNDYRLRRMRGEEVVEATLQEPDRGALVEVLIPEGSGLAGSTVGEAQLEERFDTYVLAIRRSGVVLRDSLDDVQLSTGDTVLLQTAEYAIDYLVENGDVIVTHSPEDAFDEEGGEEPLPPLSPKTPLAVGILAAVVGTAAADLLSVVIAALGGVVAMVATGCLRTSDAYDAVSWNVIFLLAGILPLGVAMQRTGGAELLATGLVAAGEVLPAIVVLGLFYLLTGLLANVITPVASVVLVLPIAIDTAARLGVTQLSFAFAVMFAASTAFMTPVGYQTNLMVYGPGGYRFTDYVRVGAPLQLVLAVVTTIAIALFWPL